MDCLVPLIFKPKYSDRIGSVDLAVISVHVKYRGSHSFVWNASEVLQVRVQRSAADVSLPAVLTISSLSPVFPLDQPFPPSGSVAFKRCSVSAAPAHPALREQLAETRGR